MDVDDIYPNTPPYRASSPYYSGLKQLESGAADALKSSYPRYSRFGTPTSDALNVALQVYESGYQSIAVSSGLAAITSVLLALAKPDTKVIFNEGVYDPVRKFSITVLEKFGVSCQFLPSEQFASLDDVIDPKTSLIYLESPSSNVFDLIDFEPCIAAAKNAGIPVVLDNTWATPLNLDPFKLGIDVSIHSASKYIGGHSDLILGLIHCNEQVYPAIRTYLITSGNAAGSEEIYSAAKGFKSLPVRIEHQSRTADIVASFLAAHPTVKKVIKPDSKQHPDFALWRKYYRGSNGLISFAIDCPDESALEAVLSELRTIKIAYSWGGSETVIVPFSTDHHSRHRDHLTYIRLSVGLEPPEQIIIELKKALSGLEKILSKYEHIDSKSSPSGSR